ncbi:MAG: hypothetical protein GX021_03995 [Tissierellia bacterium]|nr:hypothetical protein [Tissierellia bacterium]
MKVRKLLVFLLLFIFLSSSISYGESKGEKVYLIVINKLTLDDIEKMDNIKSLANNGSIGLMNTKGLSGYTGVESFLTINSSEKAYGNYNSIDFVRLEPNGPLVNKGLKKLIILNSDNNYLPHIGALGDNLHRLGLKTAIYGNSDSITTQYRSSALIPMDSQGVIDYGNIDGVTVEELDHPLLLKTDYEILFNEVYNSLGDFIVIETGDLDRLYRNNNYLSEDEYIRLRKEILLNIDNFIGKLIERIDFSNSLLIITSPNSGDPNIDDSKLTPIILWGKDVKKGVLTSATTNRHLLVTNIDIGPTIMDFFQGPKENMSGNSIEFIEEDIDISKVKAINDQINTTSKVRYNSLYYYGFFSIIILAIFIIQIITRIRFPEKIQGLFNVLLTEMLIMPSIFIIISLFRPSSILEYLIFLFTSTIISFIILWIIRKKKSKILFIGFISTFLIVLDLLLKGQISRFSVLSHDPIIGARYYGIGNEMVGLLLGSLTIFAMEILKKRNTSLLPLILYILSAILVAHPSFGANVGGTIAFVIAIAFYIKEYFNKGLDIKKVIVLFISVILVISIMAYIDINYNVSPTHLGKNILLIRDKGLNYVGQIVTRKLLTNIRLIGRSFWTYLLLVNMILHGSLIYSLYRIDKKVLLASIAGVAGAIGGFIFNDSGLILTSICMNIITIGIFLNSYWNKVE